MAKPILLSFCFLVLFSSGCLALRQQGECQLDRLNTLEPTERIQSEAGFIERWDQNDDQFQCTGVTVVRYTIERNGLFLPSFTHAPQLIYIVEGKGIQETVLPGCAETFQSVPEQSQRHQEREESPRFQDQHQKIRRIKEGDIIAIPAGVAHWTYNDGDDRLVAIVLLDLNNQENQLDFNPRRFYLAGNPQEQNEGQRRQRGPFRHPEEREQSRRRPHISRKQGQEECNNIFCAFDQEILAQAFNVDPNLVEKIQNSNDNRGPIINVEGGLQVIRPPQVEEEQGQRRREEEEGRRRSRWAIPFPWSRGGENGLEETVCTMKIKENIRDPALADVFTPEGGRITSLNSLNLPILNWLQLSAEEGFLYRNSIMAPHWHMNAHNIIYARRGRARIQVVDNNGNTVFDEEMREGQVLTVPQNFAMLKRTEEEGFEWVGFQTNDRAMINTLAGKTSVMKALPLDVIANSFQISRQDAWQLKNNRKETTLFSAHSSSPRRSVEA